MNYAFFPGCVSKGACPELYQSVMQVYPQLGIDLEEMTTASCTGAGVLQEKDEKLGDVLNARTFALAEQKGLPIMTICSTCQGVMSQANHRLTTQPNYLQEINQILQEEGLHYRGGTTIKHFLWILLEDVGEDVLRKQITKPLTGLRAAPFYGCYIQRPTEALEFEEHPDRGKSLERIIAILGAEVVDFPGKTRCCGFPILTINKINSLSMVATHTQDAKSHGADIMVTPCPLCHLNLDGMQTQPTPRPCHGARSENFRVATQPHFPIINFG
jgi:succinate dehydrogenase / fumarate reductase cytochrome b subunit